jgi:3'-phosphoadenosine 5'-phosphosulfate sulfotransferase (PAPS reductase)/FAD synthetase
MSGYAIANVSWGKDSSAMLLQLVERGYRVDEACFYDTGMEFAAIYAERDRMRPWLEAHGIKYVELHPDKPFLYNMLMRPVRKRGTDQIHAYGYGWCGGVCRWGTTEKTRALDRHAKEMGATVQYIGIAADETERLAKPHDETKCHPLAEWGMAEADCLACCYEAGFGWEQEGVRLHDVLDRVSCWCCRNKNMKELRAIHENLPETWQKLCALEYHLGTMKKKPLSEIIEARR